MLLTLILWDVCFDSYIVWTLLNLTCLAELVLNFQGCPHTTLEKSDAKIVKGQGSPFQSLQIFWCTGFAHPLTITLQFAVEAPLHIIDFSTCETPHWEADMTTLALKSLQIIQIVNNWGGNFDTPLDILLPLGHLKLQVLKVMGFHSKAYSGDLNRMIWQVNSGWQNLTCLHLPIDGRGPFQWKDNTQWINMFCDNLHHTQGVKIFCKPIWSSIHSWLYTKPPP